MSAGKQRGWGSLTGPAPARPAGPYRRGVQGVVGVAVLRRSAPYLAPRGRAGRRRPGAGARCAASSRPCGERPAGRPAAGRGRGPGLPGRREAGPAPPGNGEPGAPRPRLLVSGSPSRQGRGMRAAAPPCEAAGRLRRVAVGGCAAGGGRRVAVVPLAVPDHPPHRSPVAFNTAEEGRRGK